MKICIKCLAEKPPDEFYKHPQMSDGRLSKCKKCCRADAIANRNANIDEARKYDRERANLPHRVALRYAYQHTNEGRAAHGKSTQSWIEKNPRKRAAQILFRNRARTDISLAPQPCEHCGAKAHAHHENYDNPLEVRWLCPLHHKHRHKEMKAAGIEP